MTKIKIYFVHGLESGPNGFKERQLKSQGFDVQTPDMEMSIWKLWRKNSIIRNLLAQPLNLLRHYRSFVVPSRFSSDDSNSSSENINCKSSAATKTVMRLQHGEQNQHQQRRIKDWLVGAIDDSFRQCVSIHRNNLLMTSCTTNNNNGDYCQNVDDTNQNVNIVIGSSWGGAVLAALLANGVWTGPSIIMCPALRKKEQFSGPPPPPPYASDNGDFKAENLSYDAILKKLASCPKEIKSKWLIVHGTSDEVVPIDDSRVLANAVGVKLIEVEGGTHGLKNFVEDGRLKEFIEQLTSTSKG